MTEACGFWAPSTPFLCPAATRYDAQAGLVEGTSLNGLVFDSSVSRRARTRLRAPAGIPACTPVRLQPVRLQPAHAACWRPGSGAPGAAASAPAAS